MGPFGDVFKGGTHHGALGLSFRLTTLRTSYSAGVVKKGWVSPSTFGQGDRYRKLGEGGSLSDRIRRF